MCNTSISMLRGKCEMYDSIIVVSSHILETYGMKGLENATKALYPEIEYKYFYVEEHPSDFETILMSFPNAIKLYNKDIRTLISSRLMWYRSDWPFSYESRIDFDEEFTQVRTVKPTVVPQRRKPNFIRKTNM